LKPESAAFFQKVKRSEKTFCGYYTDCFFLLLLHPMDTNTLSTMSITPPSPTPTPTISTSTNKMDPENPKMNTEMMNTEILEQKFYQFRATWLSVTPAYKEPCMVSFYSGDTFLFHLTRNRYHEQSPGFVVEFVLKPNCHPTPEEVESKVIDPSKVLFLFNQKHGVISVFDITGKHLHDDDDNDKFIQALHFFGPYVIVDAWFWNPFFNPFLYRLDDLLRTPGYSEAKHFFFTSYWDNAEYLDYTSDGVTLKIPGRKPLQATWEEVEADTIDWDGGEDGDTPKANENPTPDETPKANENLNSDETPKANENLNSDETPKANENPTFPNTQDETTRNIQDETTGNIQN
jgi:hypothetical protein